MSRRNLKLAKPPQVTDENIPAHLQSSIKSGIKSIDEIKKQIENLQAQAQGIGTHINRIVGDELGLDPSAGDSFDIATMTYRKHPKKASG